MAAPTTRELSLSCQIAMEQFTARFSEIMIGIDPDLVAAIYKNGYSDGVAHGVEITTRVYRPSHADLCEQGKPSRNCDCEHCREMTAREHDADNKI